MDLSTSGLPPISGLGVSNCAVLPVYAGRRYNCLHGSAAKTVPVYGSFGSCFLSVNYGMPEILSWVDSFVVVSRGFALALVTVWRPAGRDPNQRASYGGKMKTILKVTILPVVFLALASAAYAGTITYQIGSYANNAYDGLAVGDPGSNVNSALSYMGYSLTSTGTFSTPGNAYTSRLTAPGTLPSRAQTGSLTLTAVPVTLFRLTASTNTRRP